MMYHKLRYREMPVYQLREAIVAVRRREENGVRIITIPHGSLVKLMGTSGEPGLVDVIWQEWHVAVFMQDLESRGALVQQLARC